MFAHHAFILWFRNLLYSYDMSSQTGALKFVDRFGSSDNDGWIDGNYRFRSIILDGERAKTMPKQFDNYNCGTGTFAAVAIILRDIPEFAFKYFRFLIT